MTREEDLFSFIDSKSFTSSGNEGSSLYCVLVEEEVEASQVLTITEEEEEEESSTIFSPHFSNPLLCSINPSSSTIVYYLYISNYVSMKILQGGTTRQDWCWRRVATF